MSLKGAKVSVIGLGKSGLASCRLLKTKGASVFASDNSEQIDREISEELKALEIDFELGGHTGKCLKDKDFMVVSPGVPLKRFPLDEAKKRGLPIYGEIELGFWFTSSPIVAITGTNGKTTTTSLLGEMFKGIGKKVTICGNIGLPLCQVAMEKEKSEVIVMEVSSFQLETIKDFRPRIGILLNITPNHLDRYDGDILAYSRVKAGLFRNQREGDVAILNRDDERVRAIPLPAGVKKIYFSLDNAHAQLIVRDGRLISYLNHREEELLASSELQLAGQHNLANALAACGAVISLFPEERGWLKTLTQFRGLPHRLELVRTVNGVNFINDSKATSVDATLKAIDSLSGNIILIAGGRDKASPFALLKEAVSSKVKKLILIGEAREKMARALAGTTRIIMAGSLKEAVLSAFNETNPGDNILLSPACASFDMFKSFEDRGEKFKKIVSSLHGKKNTP